MPEDLFFEIISVLGKRIRVTKAYWKKIVQDKHPVMTGQEEEVQDTLGNANQVRRSKSAPDVYLYYKKTGKRYQCVVVKHLDGDGFVITAYVTDNIKEGEMIWTRSK